jgi:hypothetical protein
MSQEERSVFWEVILQVILSKKKVCMYMCPIPNGFQDIAISLYSSLNLVPNIVLPSRMWFDVKRHLAVVTVDSDVIAVLWKMSHIFTNAEYADMLYALRIWVEKYVEVNCRIFEIVLY